ncbi:P-loop containing nucleoside triphosphate hydrolase protein [Clavulina sp. PMI_390]|nr:P-loop containing nucleoside triphosphate hydrolase protein [Clavulina sp. PMI_390]
MTAHVPAMKWNGPTLTQKSFDSDLAFGPEVTNEEVYKRTVQAHSLIDLVLGGGVGCVLAYGQTGSGKTHTMEAIEGFVAHDLFSTARTVAAKLLELKGGPDSLPEGVPKENPFEFRVTFLEMLGKTASDLVHGERDVPKRVEITEKKTGSIRPELEEVLVNSPEELESLIAESLSHRRVSATARNPRSSRSHAILTIWIKNLWMPAADEGQLILVDLAGSERYDDSKDHDRQRMEESKENNLSLSNLKDCVRARAKAVNDDEAFVHIPYRSNRLTLMLKPIFDLENSQLSKTIVIAHVSPHIQDSAHTVSTLSYAAPFKVAIPPPKKALKYDKTDPRTWNNEQLVAWLSVEFEKKMRFRMQPVKRVAGVGSSSAKPKTAPAPAAAAASTSKPKGPLMAVDPAKMFPAPTTGKQATRLYCGEWVALCLASTTLPTPLSPLNQRLVNDHALDVYSSFGYLWATARTRTKKAVLSHRNQDEDETYWGEAPIPWSSEVKSIPSVKKIHLYDFDRMHGSEYQLELRKLVDEAKAKGEDSDKVHREFERTSLEAYVKRLESGEEKFSEIAMRMIASGFYKD